MTNSHSYNKVKSQEMRVCLEKLLWHILNFSYAEDAKVLMSSILSSEEEGSFWICMSFQESSKPASETK